MSEFGHKLLFGENGKAVCPESGQEYLLQDNKVSKIK
jgi:UDP-2-acetamido-3-amino-2,3-dideoxy-glucuronate N-acetyltransferase